MPVVIVVQVMEMLVGMVVQVTEVLVVMVVQVMEVLVGMKEERQEAVLPSGLDLWEMDGSPLAVCEVARGEARGEGKVGGTKSGRLSMEIHSD